MVVERAFGMLKEKWRILLTRVDYSDMGMIQRIVLACCILHNLFTNTDQTDTVYEPKGRPTAELIEETAGGNTLRNAIQSTMFECEN